MVVTGHTPCTARSAGFGTGLSSTNDVLAGRSRSRLGLFAGEACSNVDFPRNAFPGIVDQCCLGRHRALEGSARAGTTLNVR